MKIIIVSGFLGSGKTTFIEKLTKRLNNFVILENDYAKANIDRDILENDQMKVVALEEGCICCSKKSDFATSVLTISNTLNPEYIIIEPTGLGYLSKVLDNIKKVEYEKIELLGPITIIDYSSFNQSLNDYGELFIDQIKYASNILISKTENVKDNDIENLINKLKKYTEANIYSQHYKNFDEKTWSNLLNSYEQVDIENKNFHHLHLDKLIYEDISFKDFSELGTVFNSICSGRFGKVVRAKGFLDVAKKMVKIDIVSKKFEIQKCAKDSYKNRLIFIGENLDNKAFDILFKKYYKKS